MKLRKLLVSIAVTVLAFMPTWIYLRTNYLLAPQGFWQKLVLASVGICCLGGLQIILFICWLAVLFMVWVVWGNH